MFARRSRNEQKPNQAAEPINAANPTNGWLNLTFGKKMIRPAIICSLVLIVAGCNSGLTEKGVPLADVLASPYALRLSVSPKAAIPGEHVTVSVEFENTGSVTLWIPRSREIFLGYERDGDGVETWSSSCDGILSVKVSPGKMVRYEKDFVVPPLYGEIKIHIGNRRDINTLLEVKKEPNHPTEPHSPNLGGSS